MKIRITYTVCFLAFILPASAHLTAVVSDLESICTLEDRAAKLPVIILEFRGRVENGQFVRLNWLVRDEDNLDYYEVQKMFQGAWTPIDRVQATGGDEYNYLDYTLRPRMEYRLKAVDLDGSFEYSAAIRIKYKGFSSFFNIFPNPFSDSFKIINENDDYEYQIYDSMGNLLADGVTGQDDIERASLKLDRGIYFINVMDKKTRVRETIKIRKN